MEKQAKRFRPNLIVAGGEAFREDYWKTVKIGNLVFEVGESVWFWFYTSFQRVIIFIFVVLALCLADCSLSIFNPRTAVNEVKRRSRVHAPIRPTLWVFM